MFNPIALTFRLKLQGESSGAVGAAGAAAGVKLHYNQWECRTHRPAPFSWLTHQ